MDGKMSQLASEVAEHYGYSDISTFRGMWPIQPSVLEKIKLLPEFTRALVQIFTDQTSRQGHPCGKIGDFVKSSGEVQ